MPLVIRYRYLIATSTPCLSQVSFLAFRPVFCFMPLSKPTLIWCITRDIGGPYPGIRRSQFSNPPRRRQLIQFIGQRVPVPQPSRRRVDAVKSLLTPRRLKVVRYFDWSPGPHQGALLNLERPRQPTLRFVAKWCPGARPTEFRSMRREKRLLQRYTGCEHILQLMRHPPVAPVGPGGTLGMWLPGAAQRAEDEILLLEPPEHHNLSRVLGNMWRSVTSHRMNLRILPSPNHYLPQGHAKVLWHIFHCRT